jgi:hypothetical protein
MTHDDLMRLAYEAGAKDHPNPDQWGILTISHDDIERLAAFVMLYEREECAKVANAWQTDVLNPLYHCDCATAIRRRGEK